MCSTRCTRACKEVLALAYFLRSGAGALLRRTQTPLLRTKTSAMPRGSNGSASTFACLQTVAKRGAADEPFFNNVGGGWLLTVDGKPLFYKLHMCSSRGDCNRGQRLLARAQGRRSSVRHARRPRTALLASLWKNCLARV